MIRIKVVDEQNILEVCKLTANHKGGDFAAEGCKTCNALSIAEAKFLPEMHLNAIYHNQVLVGFFQYQRAEDHADLATIRRFMIGEPFRHKGLGKEAFAYALKGLKIQGSAFPLALRARERRTKRNAVTHGNSKEHCKIKEEKL